MPFRLNFYAFYAGCYYYNKQDKHFLAGTKIYGMMVV